MAELNLESDLEDALAQSLSSFPDVKSLKAEQRLVIGKVVEGRDVFAQLPTGFGKSLAFQLLPPLLKCLNTMGHSFPSNPLVVVVSPLLSIMEDQVRWLRSLGFKAAFVGESSQTDRCIVDGEGHLDFLYGSPESLLGDVKFREMFGKEFYRKNAVAIVCDEVHTVVDWGESNSNQKSAFRKWCGLVGEIRSLLPGVPLLALTATATAVTRKKIMTLLSFNHGIEIVVSPNRNNVKLCVQKVTNDIPKTFSWLAEEIEAKGVSCPRTLIYVKDYQRCGEMFNFLMQTLGDKSYWPRQSKKKSANRIIAMYHSGTVPKIQKHVLSSLKDSEGSVRIIIATSALGMGVDIKGLHRVINYGPPNDMESYVQAFGRAGRDGKNSEALLLFHGHQLHLCQPEMLDFLRSDTCRRKKILAQFDDNSDQAITPSHLCCDVCANNCQCGEGECPDGEGSMLFLLSQATSTNQEVIQKREVSEAEREKLKELLTECQEQMRHEIQQSRLHCLYSNIDHFTCFSTSVIQDTLDKCDQLYSLDNIMETICVWNSEHANKILSCLKAVFKDLQDDCS